MGDTELFPMKRTPLISFTVLFCGILSACHEAPHDAPVAHQPAPKSTLPEKKTFELDLDGDAKPDSIVLQGPLVPDGPGQYEKLTVQFANGKVAEVSGSWDDAREDEHPWSGNLLPTRSLYVAQFAEAGTLLFLFGEDLGCCFQSMQIFQVSEGTIAPYYAQQEFYITHELRPAPEGVTLLTGLPTRIEETASSAPGAEKSISYVPTVVVRLATRAEVDVEASEEATRQRLGGFAGVRYREDLLAVTTTTGEKFLWSESEMRRLE